MNPDNNDTIFVTYTYPKRCKWKIKTVEIKQEELAEYELKYRVLSVMDYDWRDECKREEK